MLISLLCFFKKFFNVYFRERDRERERERENVSRGGAERERETQNLKWAAQAHAGLKPMNPEIKT